MLFILIDFQTNFLAIFKPSAWTADQGRIYTGTMHEFRWSLHLFLSKRGPLEKWHRKLIFDHIVAAVLQCHNSGIFHLYIT